MFVFISDAISDRSSNITYLLITASNKSNYGVLRMRDFRAGRLKRLKNERLHSTSDQRAGKRTDRFRLSFVLSTAIYNTLFHSSCSVTSSLPAVI